MHQCAGSRLQHGIWDCQNLKGDLMQVGYGTAKAGALIRIGTNDGSRGRYATLTAEGGRPHICNDGPLFCKKSGKSLESLRGCCCKLIILHIS